MVVKIFYFRENIYALVPGTWLLGFWVGSSVHPVVLAVAAAVPLQVVQQAGHVTAATATAAREAGGTADAEAFGFDTGTPVYTGKVYNVYCS